MVLSSSSCDRCSLCLFLSSQSSHVIFLQYYVDLDKTRAHVPFFAEREKQYIEDLEDEERVQKGHTPGSMRAANGQMVANVDPLWILDMVTVHNEEEQKTLENGVRVLSLRGSQPPSRDATPSLRAANSETLPVPLFLPTEHISEEDEEHCALEAQPEEGDKPRSILHSSHFGPSKALNTVPFLPEPVASDIDIPALPALDGDLVNSADATGPLSIVLTGVTGESTTVDPVALAETEPEADNPNDNAADDEEYDDDLGEVAGNDPYKSRRPRGVLFLGGWKQSYGKWPRKHKIGLIVNCARIPDIMAAGTEERMAEWVADSKKLEEEGVKYHRLPWYDNPKQRLWDKTPWDTVAGAVMAIHKALSEEKNVLVHCRKGRSRSATVVISYLMSRHGFGRSEALNWVKDRRPSVSPNAGFMQQLLDLQKSPMMVYLRERIGMDFLDERQRYLARKEAERKEKEEKKEKEKEKKEHKHHKRESKQEQLALEAQCSELAQAQQVALTQLEETPIASPDVPRDTGRIGDVLEEGITIAVE